MRSVAGDEHIVDERVSHHPVPHFAYVAADTDRPGGTAQKRAIERSGVASVRWRPTMLIHGRIRNIDRYHGWTYNSERLLAGGVLLLTTSDASISV